MSSALIQLLNNHLDTTFHDTMAGDKLFNELSNYIGSLIDTDFQRLIRLLYQVDINEETLKNLLRENDGRDSAKLIAALIIERQLQKLETRKSYKQYPPQDENEKW